MLSWTCRRFRARFAPGSSPPHRRACRECDAFATVVESAAGVRLPIPGGLENSLREIAKPSVLTFPVPRLPMPEALAGRLRNVAPPSRPAPPEWVRDPRYAVAASALLALLLGPFFSMGADRGLHALGTVREEGREEIAKVRAGAREAYEAARRSLARSAESLHGFSDRLSTVVPENPFNPDPEDEPEGSSRRPR
ncbi:MAG TPA: hypothetical protein VHC97_08130 [Thermoanaerobaculia bacterium]|jgi:hypothetical protein|nr:hypothetical protein [Thermoanaerobaculia bacterium]